jgi:hypothetical protein
MGRELPSISHAEQFCDTYVLAKHHHGVFPKQSKYHANKALELVHGDLYGRSSQRPPAGDAISYCSSMMPPLHVGCAPDSQVRGIECHQAHLGGGGKGMRLQALGAEDRQRRGVHNGRVCCLLC